MNTLTISNPAPLAIAEDVRQQANQAAKDMAFSEYLSEKSKNTLRRHRADLTLFCKYLAVNGAIHLDADDLAALRAEALSLMSGKGWQDINYGLVKLFVNWQLAEGYAIGSINNRLSTVKVYARLALKAGVLAADEFVQISAITGYNASKAANIDDKREVSRVGLKKATNTGLTSDQADRLKAGLRFTSIGTPLQSTYRDMLITRLLLNHGLRVSELVSLKVGDFDTDTSMLSFKRIKTKTEAIPHRLKSETLEAMTDYLERYGSDDPAAPLLQASNKTGALIKAGMTTQAVNELVGKLGRKVGVSGLSPHDLRHYAATRLAANGWNIRQLMDFFGWTSAATAMRYVDAANFVELE